MKRVIFVEPDIDSKEDIYNLFNEYNPDSSFVNPHICLVFPFESELNSEEINSLFNKVLVNTKAFTIKLNGLEISYEQKNNYLFLNVIDEDNILSNISSLLYDNLESYTKLKGDYNPHITIGKTKSIERINNMKDSCNILMEKEYVAKIDKIYSKILVKDENQNIKLQDEITYNLSNV